MRVHVVRSGLTADDPAARPIAKLKTAGAAAETVRFASQLKRRGELLDAGEVFSLELTESRPFASIADAVAQGFQVVGSVLDPDGAQLGEVVGGAVLPPPPAPVEVPAEGPPAQEPPTEEGAP